MTAISDAPPYRLAGEGPAPRPRRARRTRREVARRYLPVVGLVVGILGQELVVRSGVVSATDFPPFTVVARALLDALAEGAAWRAIGDTLYSAIVGLVIAGVAAIPIGIALASSQIAFRATRLVVEFLRPIPPITLVPLAILVFGTQQEMKLLLIVFGCFWPILVQTMAGVLDVDPVLKDVARTSGFSRAQTFRQVTLPAAAPYIATGLRLSASFAVGLSIVSELVGGASGLGQMIYQAQLAGDSGRPLMYGVVLLAASVGGLLEMAFRTAERRILSWHESYRVVEK